MDESHRHQSNGKVKHLDVLSVYWIASIETSIGQRITLELSRPFGTFRYAFSLLTPTNALGTILHTSQVLLLLSLS